MVSITLTLCAPVSCDTEWQCFVMQNYMYEHTSNYYKKTCEDKSKLFLFPFLYLVYFIL